MVIIKGKTVIHYGWKLSSQKVEWRKNTFRWEGDAKYKHYRLTPATRFFKTKALLIKALKEELYFKAGVPRTREEELRWKRKGWKRKW